MNLTLSKTKFGLPPICIGDDLICLSFYSQGHYNPNYTSGIDWYPLGGNNNVNETDPVYTPVTNTNTNTNTTNQTGVTATNNNPFQEIIDLIKNNPVPTIAIVAGFIFLLKR